MVSSFGQRYDYGSIMHYDAYAFSANGNPTIVPKVMIFIKNQFFCKIT